MSSWNVTYLSDFVLKPANADKLKFSESGEWRTLRCCRECHRHSRRSTYCPNVSGRTRGVCGIGYSSLALEMPWTPCRGWVGRVPCRNSTNKHKTVHVPHDVVFEPWTDTFSHTDNVGILVEGSSEILSSFRVEEIDEGTIVTPTNRIDEHKQHRNLHWCERRGLRLAICRAFQ